MPIYRKPDQMYKNEKKKEKREPISMWPCGLKKKKIKESLVGFKKKKVCLVGSQKNKKRKKRKVNTVALTPKK